MKQKTQSKNKIVVVSGGFDPIHIGHIRYFKEAKRLGDKLVVVLNNDNWLKHKKEVIFMPEKERKELLEAIDCVDKVVLTKHKVNDTDKSINHILKNLKPSIFANGGDRTAKNIPEVGVCKEINCKMIFNVGKGGKVQSSSWLLDKFKNVQKDKRPLVGIGVMVLKDGKVLLGKRKSSHGKGEWAWPGGHLEYMESFNECAKREVMEEAGIKIKNIRLLRLHNLKEYAPKHYADIGLIADWQSGIPKVCEPDKIDGWGWFDLDKLPKPIFKAIHTYLKAYKTGQNYFDF